MISPPCKYYNKSRRWAVAGVWCVWECMGDERYEHKLLVGKPEGN